MSMSKRVSNWFNERLKLDELPFFRTPDYMYHVSDWLGALVAAAFMYTVISGLILLLYYDPDNGYNSTQFIINQVPYGSVVLYSHLYGAYAMIILAYIHMFRNYFVGAYKKPRELLWILGVFLLVLTMGASFFGYSLIGDVLATSAVDVGAGIIESIPGMQWLVPFFFGNYDNGQYGRVLAWHIIFVALIGLLFVFHFFLAESYGMMPSRKVKSKAPAVYTREEWMKFNPWWPRNFVYMLSLILMTWGFILIIPNALAYLNGLPQYYNPFLNPKPAPPPTSPLAATVTTYPPWFFLFFYKIADFSSNVLLDLSIGAIIPLVYLILLPFLDRSEELHPLSRKIFIGIEILMVIYLIQTTLWGDIAPGVPVAFKCQVVALLPPAVIVAIGLWILPSKKSSEEPRVKHSFLHLGKALVPLAILGFVIISLLFVGGLAEFVNYPSPITLAILLPIASLFVIGAKRIAPIIIRMEQQQTSSASSPEVSKLEMKKKFAQYIIVVLFVLSLVLMVTLWTIPPTGYESNMFGVDLGLIFVMWGEAISLYHYIVYKKPNESYE